MKRIIIYIIVLAALLLAPVKGADIGRLRPVETVFIYHLNDQVVIETDTSDWGMGSDSAAALENLKDTTPGTIYLDTAEYLLIGEDAQEAAQQLRPVLKKSVRLCVAEQGIDLTAAADFLSGKDELTRLKDWTPGDNLPHLKAYQGRLILIESTRKRNL